MAIQPIDLQTLYSQLENVSKTVAHQQQGMQLAQSIRQETYGKQVAEQSTVVQQLKSDKSDVLTIKDRKSSGGENQGSEKKQHSQEDDLSQDEHEPVCFQDPNLGKYIDISG